MQTITINIPVTVSYEDGYSLPVKVLGLCVERELTKKELNDELLAVVKKAQERVFATADAIFKDNDMQEAEIAEAVEAQAIETNREEGDSGELV